MSVAARDTELGISSTFLKFRQHEKANHSPPISSYIWPKDEETHFVPLSGFCPLKLRELSHGSVLCETCYKKSESQLCCSPIAFSACQSTSAFGAEILLLVPLCKLLQDRHHILLIIDSLCLVQYLAHDRQLINVCWMHEWVRGEQFFGFFSVAFQLFWYAHDSQGLGTQSVIPSSSKMLWVFCFFVLLACWC